MVFQKSATFALFLCLILAIPTVALPQQRPAVGGRQLSSRDLGAAVLGKNVKLMMRDGTYVEGKVLRANADEIFVHIKKSEPKGRVRTAEAALRTADIGVVHLRENGSMVLSIVLGVVGGLAGGVAVSYAADNVKNDGTYKALSWSGAAGAAAAGVFGGRAAVKKTITITVVPSSNQSFSE